MHAFHALPLCSGMVFLRLSANGGKTIDVINERMAQSLLDQLFMDGKATRKTIIPLHDELEKMSAPSPPPGDVYCSDSVAEDLQRQLYELKNKLDAVVVKHRIWKLISRC